MPRSLPMNLELMLLCIYLVLVLESASGPAATG
jgi:hypothetical protein